MGLFSKKTPEEKQAKKEEITMYCCTTQQTIGNIPSGSLVVLSFTPSEKKLNITLDSSVVKLPYERIRGFSVENETNLVNGKTSIGGAIVGGALFGAAGAIIGATKNKGKAQNRWFASLTYTDKDGNNQELIFIEGSVFGDYEKNSKSLNAIEFENVIRKIVSQYQPQITEL